MGGSSANDDLSQAHLTQAWLAVSEDKDAKVSGAYFYHLKRMVPNPQALNVALQDRLLERCAQISGVSMPE